MNAHSAPPAVEVRGLGKKFGSVTALNDVSLSIQQGELVSLLGASGSGKTTLLRMIAGFDTPSTGEIYLNGREVTTLSPAERDIGMVFQNYALFPHLTVRKNIEYGLKMRRWSKPKRAKRATEMLERMRLTELGDRMPSELSGGQQQRVSIARALAFSPSLLLMDEPLGALDKALKENLLGEIRRVHREFNTTIVYVTHDREEALVLSDRIALMDAAELKICAPVKELYLSPATAFAARFISGSNIMALDGTPITLLEQGHDSVTVGVDGSSTRLPYTGGSRDLALAVRPGSFELAGSGPIDGLVMHGTVLEQVFLGDSVKVQVTLPGVEAPVHTLLSYSAGGDLQSGDDISLALRRTDLTVVAR